jgi:hypothetical protein
MQKVGEYKMSVAIGADKKLTFTRDFRFGDNGSILFPSKAYAQIKQVFDFIYQTDNSVVTLRNIAKTE